jgi:hypothetical protein
MILKEKLPPKIEGRVVIEIFPDDEKLSDELQKKITAKVIELETALENLSRIIGIDELSIDLKLAKNLSEFVAYWRDNLSSSKTLWQASSYQNEHFKRLMVQFSELELSLNSRMEEFHKESVFTPEEIQQVR